MPTAYKPFHTQGTTAVTTYTTLYNVPASTESVISSIVVCNTNTSAATFRVGIDDAAGDPLIANGEFLVYDATIAANDTITLTLGVALDAGKYIRVSSSEDTVLFSVFVSEIS